MTTFAKHTSVVPKAYQPNADMLWGYATVEVVDTQGDIVRVEGVNWQRWHKEGKSHLKLLVEHQPVLPDGQPAIIGRVETFVKTTVPVDGQNVPALMFGASYAKGPDGQLTPLAAAYKTLYDSGYMDSFSIGAVITKAKPTPTGYDIISCDLMEISAVAVPANASAVALRAVGDAFKAAGVDVKDDIAHARIRRVIQDELSVALARLTAKLDERFDDFIGRYVVRSESLGGPPHNHNAAATDASLIASKVAEKIKGAL